jgi:methylene-tetrahydrofolate reductase-like protein
MSTSNAEDARAAAIPASAAGPPRPTTPRASARSMYLLHHLLEPNAGYRRLAAWLEARPRLRRMFTAAEKGVKQEIFGCRMCGQCALPSTGYACPMTCPKQLRNGPCGGVGSDGGCEVYPQLRCVWLTAFERAESQGRSADLQRLQLPIDHRLWGESSWIRYWQGRDDELWTDAGPIGAGPIGAGPIGAAEGHRSAGSRPAALPGPGASGP